jgi:hypothetical protein
MKTFDKKNLGEIRASSSGKIVVLREELGISSFFGGKNNFSGVIDKKEFETAVKNLNKNLCS